jgi:hypothetical protein
LITADIKQDTTDLKNETGKIKGDTGQIREDTDNILREIQVLQTQVAGLDIQDGRGLMMQRFLTESVTYAESGYAGSTAGSDEVREGEYET